MGEKEKENGRVGFDAGVDNDEAGLEIGSTGAAWT